MSGKTPIRRKYQPKGLEILHDDRDIIVVDKSAGLLTVSTGREDKAAAFSSLTNYVRKGNHKSKARLFLVQRLDRGCSGVLVFAKSEKAKRSLLDQWSKADKTFLAFVEGQPEEAEGALSSHLTEGKPGQVFSSENGRGGKPSRMEYKVLKTMGSRAQLEIALLTDRKNQIRVQLADQGWPIVGDGKYGRKIRNAKRIALHSHILSFDHPHSGERMTFTAPPSACFNAMAFAPRPIDEREAADEKPSKG